MRIAFVAPSATPRSAVGNLIAEKAAFFLEREAEVRVFVETADAVHPTLSPHIQRLTSPPASGPAWDYLANSDLVFFEYSIGFALAGLLPMLAAERPKVVVTYYGLSLSADWPGPQREILERGRRERGMLWCADAVVVFSRFLMKELASVALPAERIHQQKVPIDIERWSASESCLARGERRLSDAENGPILLYVGRLAPNKRVSLLIQALKKLPGAQAWIVGSDRDVYAEQARQVRDISDRLGVADRVRWLGDVADEALPEVYRQADALLLPSVHEGFGIPVIEAQAAGLPVIAARAAALPETVGDAGLTFRPDDVDDFVRQIGRVLVGQASSLPVEAPRESADPARQGQAGSLPHKLRVAIACFRFGSGFVGGAETSLRTIGRALQRSGCDVEIFTTRTIRESDWRNDLAAGDTIEDGFSVHRYPIDPFDKDRHDRAFRTIVEKNGDVAPAVEAEYLANSIQSAALIDALRGRIGEFDAVIAGPYPHALTFRVTQAFPEKTLLLPCFHDEPPARLRSWVDVYGAAGGFLFHTPEERDFAQESLGLNHPGATVVGTCLQDFGRDTPHPRPLSRKGRGEQAASLDSDGGAKLAVEPATSASPDGGMAQSAPSPLAGEGRGEGDRVASNGRPRTLVYCGRYSVQKNVPQLIEFARRYQIAHPNRFRWIFMGEGAVAPPAEPWCRDLGRVSEDEKNAVLARADALVQLSTQESLSLVVLEAWRHAAPVIVDGRCSVLVGQLQRSNGGTAIHSYESFAAALDELAQDPESWRQRGENGRRYVEAEYLNPDGFTKRILGAIGQLQRPLAEQLRKRGLMRAQQFCRNAWREEFGRFVEQVLDLPPRSPRFDISVEPVAKALRSSLKQSTLLVPCRATNRGDMPAVANGLAATRIEVTLRDDATGEIVLPPKLVPLGEWISPGQSAAVLVPIELPRRIGQFALTLEVMGTTRGISVPLEIGADSSGGHEFEGGVGPILESAQSALAAAFERQTLPADYLDVTEGRFGKIKRWLKQKLLNNFKRAYVDVLSAQQSEVNRRLIESVRQLSECCQALDQTVRQLQERIAAVERVAKNENVTAEDAECAENLTWM